MKMIGHKRTIGFFATILVAGIIFVPRWTGAQTLPEVTQAPPTSLEVRIGELTQAANIAEYIAGVFRYALSIGGVIATVMVVYGGVKWLMAAGDPGKITEAKQAITNAVLGLILLLGSYLILFTINPEIVRLRALKIPSIQQSQLPLSQRLSCAQGSLRCICRENDPDNPNACDSGLRCVETRSLWSSEAFAQREVAGAIVANLIVPFSGTIGLLIDAGKTINACTDGSLASPCSAAEDCKGGLKCHSKFFLCYKTPAALGEVCEEPGDCQNGGTCQSNFCRGQGARGDFCQSGAECKSGFFCQKPQNGLGRCETFSAETKGAEARDGAFCVRTTTGINPTGCGPGASSSFKCAYCPGSGERVWKALDLETDPQSQRVGQCKPPDKVGQNCAQ